MLSDEQFRTGLASGFLLGALAVIVCLSVVVTMSDLSARKALADQGCIMAENRWVCMDPTP